MLKEKGWTQDELATITGYSRQTINELISGKNGITKPEMAVALAAAFGNAPIEWMQWDAAYKLSLVKEMSVPVQTAARLYELAPIRDMQKRGWIRETKNASELEEELKEFFCTDSLDEPPHFPVAMRHTSSLPFLSSSERAWCFRARQLASALTVVGEFGAGRLKAARQRLRELAAYPKEVRHLPRILSEFGIRFLVIEPLPGTKVDGAAFWVEESSPSIAVSVRIDRIDNFWFTVFHELAHIENGDALSVDSDLLAEQTEPNATGTLLQDEMERRANEQAAATLIPHAEMASFIRRISPLYSKERIVQFAHKLRIHPGVIVGQLQRRNEIGYSANREMLAKVRGSVVETALTDGWGRTITPLVLVR